MQLMLLFDQKKKLKLKCLPCRHCFFSPQCCRDKNGVILLVHYCYDGNGCSAWPEPIQWMEERKRRSVNEKVAVGEKLKWKKSGKIITRKHNIKQKTVCRHGNTVQQKSRFNKLLKISVKVIGIKEISLLQSVSEASDFPTES